MLLARPKVKVIARSAIQSSFDEHIHINFLIKLKNTA